MNRLSYECAEPSQAQPSPAELSGPEGWYCDVTAEGLRRLAGVAETTRSAALDWIGSVRPTLLWACAAVGLRRCAPTGSEQTDCSDRPQCHGGTGTCTGQLQTPEGYSKG